jgi:hypothetical protein
MSNKLEDLSITTLHRMLRATQRLAGVNCQTAEILRRVIAKKRKALQAQAQRKPGEARKDD